MEGWVSFHRKIKEWEWYTDGNTFRLFFHLVLEANHQDRKWRGQLIKRGQLITGRKELSKQLNMSEQQIRTSFNKLKSTNEITSKSTNKFTLVTVVNYDLYQSEEGRSTNKSPTNQPTSNQQVTTNNNVKNIKKDNSQTKWSDEHIEYRLSNYLFKHMKNNNPSVRKPNLQNWCTHIDRMIRLDNREPNEIKKVIEWSQKDSFWMTNILSTSKLRDKYDQLYMNMNKKETKKQKGGETDDYYSS